MISKYFMLAIAVLWSCKSSSNAIPTEKEEDDKKTVVVASVSNLAAGETDKKNELKITWNNPTATVSVMISYTEEGTDEEHTVTPHIRTEGENRSSYVLKLPRYATYKIAAVAMDNYGRKSESLTVTATPAKEDAPLSYEIIGDKLPIADPYVLYYEGRYYAYGTRINGFEVYISEDLKHWKRSTNLALSPENSWGTRWYWAPEVYYVASKNRFYMFYSVDEHICVASSNRPEGPFIQQEKTPIVSEKAIDTHLYIDEDGTPYLYYVRFTGGNVIWVAEMNDDLRTIKTETLTKCISAEEPWERKQGTITEGPSVIKHGNMYYLMYSANHFESQDYAVGYATSNSPKGPWKKYNGNPILRRDKPAASGLVGTGHGAPFITADGSYNYIYHAHANMNSVGPRTSYINDMTISEDGVIRISGEAIKPVLVK
ncbi:glycoside hydrolase family 43 protein [Sphingobacterium alkalisoli]|nr:glycoside hydrolase family 43 protein [Sphingobacterium alkalisoli]